MKHGDGQLILKVPKYAFYTYKGKFENDNATCTLKKKNILIISVDQQVSILNNI